MQILPQGIFALTIPEEDSEPTEPTYELQDLEYIVYTAQDKDYWFDVIEKSYGMWGEVTVEEKDIAKPLTAEEQRIADAENAIAELSILLGGVMNV